VFSYIYAVAETSVSRRSAAQRPLLGKIDATWRKLEGRKVIVPTKGTPETRVGKLCTKLGITRQTPYRFVSPTGELRDDGRIERTLFMINWIMDTGMQRRARVGLNKGESHHALKQAINFYRRGEIRDRTTEGQHYRIAGLNLLAAAIIFWNTLKLGEAVKNRSQTGLPVPPELLAHVSPLGWEHINLIGEYSWPIS
jgi:hypothetical protein